MTSLDFTERVERRLARRKADGLAKEEERKARCLAAHESAIIRSWIQSCKPELRPWAKGLRRHHQIMFATAVERKKAERARRIEELAAAMEERAPAPRARSPRPTVRPQPAVRAIETHYRGYRFRSRLEARWAVALTAQQIDWDYEPEGFELPSGRYLPDFWLPDVQAWAEVKPIALSDREMQLACELVKATGFRMQLLVGTPSRDTTYQVLMPFNEGTCWARPIRMTRRAVEAARAARFEHGECPA